MKKTRKSIFLKIVLGLLVFILISLIALIVYIIFGIDKEIDPSLIRTGGSSFTRIYYFDYDDRENRIGEPYELVEETLFLQRSEWKSIYDMPVNLKNAFIAIEDRRFYEHNGVDWARTGKATVNYVFKGDKNTFGGSTITQQLIKNLTGDNKVNAKRKLEEIFRALNLEKRLSKNEILEHYLNVVYLSNNCYGVGAAAKLYFNKEIEDLTLNECASLASIVKNPSKYDPYLNPNNNLSRRKIVLKEMLSQGYISENEYNTAIDEELKVNENIDDEKNSGIYSWYTEALVNDVANGISKAYNLDFETSRRLILKGGLNIYSTIDPKVQKELESIYESYPSYILPSEGAYPQSSCVVIDPKTSDVIALVGGTGKKTANMLLNRATMTKRAPGSVIKPLSVYAPAFEEGLINYATIFDDTPINKVNGEFWPKNSPNRYRGLMPISYAIEKSVNTVAVKALELLGKESSYRYLTEKFKLTLDSVNDMAPSPLALGQLTNGESVLNITNAYTSFANGGYISNPKTYLYVTDNYGNVILENEDNTEKIISNETAEIMTKLLENVVNTGTAKSITAKDKVAIAGKTGTTSELKDRWFVGYTNDYVCGVWTGFDTPKPIYISNNPSVTIFDELMNRLYDDSYEREELYLSNKIISSEFCMDSGKLPCEECRNDLRGTRIVTGYFIKGTEPHEVCDLHKRVYIDVLDGKIADEFTPIIRKRPVSLLNFDRKQEYNDIIILDSEFFIKNRIKKEN